MIIDSKIVNEIYDNLADTESKEVFMARLNFSMIPNAENLRKIARYSQPIMADFIDKVMGFVKNGSKVCVYGAGNGEWYPGRIVLGLFEDYLNDICLFDRNESLKEEIYTRGFGEKIKIDVHSPKKIKELNTDIVMIVSTPNPKFQEEITELLLDSGIPLNKIIFYPPLYLYFGEAYFSRHNNILKFGKDEVLVDCGCYDGQTVKSFLKEVDKFENASVKRVFFL